MVLRSGAKQGRARFWDKAGAFAGFTLPVVLVVFTVWFGSRTDGYSHISDTISRLGAAGAPGDWWFRAVNFLGAGTGDAHGRAASLTAVAIVAFLLSASWALGRGWHRARSRRRDRGVAGNSRPGWFAWFTWAATAVTAVDPGRRGGPGAGTTGRRLPRRPP